MPLAVSDLDTLEEYLLGVMERTGHHAPQVGAVTLALIGAVLWKKDADSQFEIRTTEGAKGNLLWFHMAGTRYVLAYNHHDRCIDLRERSQQGTVVHKFTNKTPVIDVWKVFEQLKPTP